MKNVDVVALSAVSKKLEQWIDKLGVKLKIEHLQKTSILGTARILRKTQESRLDQYHLGLLAVDS